MFTVCQLLICFVCFIQCLFELGRVPVSSAEKLPSVMNHAVNIFQLALLLYHSTQTKHSYIFEFPPPKGIYILNFRHQKAYIFEFPPTKGICIFNFRHQKA